MMYKSCGTVIVILQLFIYLTMTYAATFKQANLCDVQTRVSNKCMTQVSTRDSMLKCCVRCSSNSDCLGASLQLNTSSCYIHNQCSGASNCAKGDPGYKYYLKKLPCRNGTWNEATSTCKCTYPYTGSLCERLPSNCTDFGQYWPSTYGNTMIQFTPPPLLRKIIATCIRTKTSLSTLVLRNTGELTFNRTWKEYTQGFLTYPPPYNLSYWVGMEAMRAFMGSAPRDIRLNIVFNSSSPTRFDHRYTGVVIGDTSTNYLLTYDSHQSLSGTSEGYCLELSNMTTFSTWDADHDGNITENLAAKAGAGWWFPTSNATCNPLGSFYSTPPATEDGYVRFTGVSRDLIQNSLVQIEMLIEDPYA